MALYTPTVFVDGAAGNTPITAAELNKIGTGIQTVLPSGGTINQVLAKNSGTSYDTKWATPASVSGLPFVNVKTDYGAVGDGTTNDATAIQNAHNSLSATGNAKAGTIFFPPGNYYCGTTTLNFSTRGVKLMGAGGTGQSNSAGTGSSRLVWGAGVTTGFQYNSGGSNSFAGMSITDMEFCGPSKTDSGNGIGVLMTNTSNVYMANVTIHDFPTGMQAAGASGAQDWTCANLNINSCHVGLDVNNTNEIKLFGGMFLGVSVATAPATGDYAIDLDNASGTFYLYGTSIKGWDVGINMQSQTTGQSGDHMFFAPRFEGFNTAMNIGDRTRVHVYGGNYNNSSRFGPGQGGTAFNIGASGTNILIIASSFSNVLNKLVDGGATNPTYLIDGSFKPAWGCNQYYLSGTGAVTDSNLTNAGLTPTNGMCVVRDNSVQFRVAGVWKSATIA